MKPSPATEQTAQDRTRERAAKTVSRWLTQIQPGESLVSCLARQLCERDIVRARTFSPDDQAHLGLMVKRWASDVADVKREAYQQRLVDRILNAGYRRGKP